MTTWFVSRHPGALQWMRRHGPSFDRHVTHLAAADVQPGDRVYGTLPVPMACEVCERGATYFHLSVPLPETARGSELSVDQLEVFGTNLQRFDVRRM
ncbi:hypothetical protein MASR1M50_29640 [Burkholderiales bacterium]